MTRRDYIFLAEAFGMALAGTEDEQEEGAVRYTIDVVCLEIADANPAFDAKLFVDNCNAAKQRHIDHKTWDHPSWVRHHP